VQDLRLSKRWYLARLVFDPEDGGDSLSGTSLRYISDDGNIQIIYENLERKVPVLIS
jgi:hypothetical protein